MTGLVRALERRSRLARARLRLGSEEGFTLVEMIVTLLILAIVISLSTVLIVGFNQSSTNIINTTTGVSQAELAQRTLVQYLRGVSTVLATYNSAGQQVGPSPTEFDAVTNEGFDTSTSTSSCTNLDALWLAPAATPGAPAPDARFDVTFDVPAAGPTAGDSPTPAPWSDITPVSDIPDTFGPPGPPSSPSACSPLGSTSRTVASYYALRSQAVPVFTYYSSSPSGLVPITPDDPVSPSEVSQIAAVGIHVTFLAGPQQPRGAFAGVQSTTLDTLVYLQGAATAS